MKQIIVFGEDLGGLPSSTQHLIKNLPRDWQVIWVNSIGLRQPKLSIKDVSRAFNKVLQTVKPKKKVQYSDITKNITEVNLLTIPAPASNLARWVAKKLMLIQLKPILKKNEFTNPILWTSLPTVADLCGQLNESAVVYYCGDDFSALAGVDHHTVAKHESQLADKADLILVASEKLQSKFPDKNAVLLAHGVDLEHFVTPHAKALDFPSNGKKVAGFYGSLSEWIDYDLIAYAADTLPEWDFLFIGPNHFKFNPLPSRRNIHYIGPRAHKDLPSYSQHWNVSLMPFKKNAQIMSCNPLKLMEYLAINKPIVTIDFPALTPYRQHLFSASNKEDFTQAIPQSQRKTGHFDTQSLQSKSWIEKSRWLSRTLESL